jgi:fucose 4-O-acetylase-like acetyltransferase
MGIVLHASLSFVANDWIVQDSNPNEALGFITASIHGFRMPLFFMMSGF